MSTLTSTAAVSTAAAASTAAATATTATATTAATTAATATTAIISKNARKRQLKDQRYHENKRRKKEAQKLKKAAARKIREAAQALLPPPPVNPQSVEIAARRARDKLARKTTYLDAVAAAPRIIIDLDFEEKLTDKEKKSMAQQLMYCYGMNKRATHPLGLHFAGLRGSTETRLSNISGFSEGWLGVTTSATPYELDPTFDPSSLVYLTADADHVLDELDANKNYIIGGIVDRKRTNILCCFLVVVVVVVVLGTDRSSFGFHFCRQSFEKHHVSQSIGAKNPNRTISCAKILYFDDLQSVCNQSCV
jgi:tRNA (guanine9-N1)-methyltransferase